MTTSLPRRALRGLLGTGHSSLAAPPAGGGYSIARRALAGLLGVQLIVPQEYAVESHVQVRDPATVVQHVFVSYDHADQDFAENVIARLEKAGYATWSDLKIPAGESWRNAIDQAIRNASALVVIMTPTARASEYVTYEWAYALGLGVRVVPVMLRLTSLHPRLEVLQNFDFTGSKSRPWERLLNELQAPSPISHSVSIPINSPHLVRQVPASLGSAVSNDWRGAVESRAPETRTLPMGALARPLPDVLRTAGIGVFRPIPPDFVRTREQVRKIASEMEPELDEGAGMVLDNLINARADQWLSILNREYVDYQQEMLFWVGASAERVRTAATVQQIAAIQLVDAGGARTAVQGYAKRNAERRYRKAYAKNARLQAELDAARADAGNYEDLLSIAEQVRRESALEIIDYREQLKILAHLEIAKRSRNTSAADVSFTESDQPDSSSVGPDFPADV